MWAVLVPLALCAASATIGCIIGNQILAGKINLIAQDKETWDKLRRDIIDADMKHEIQTRIMKEMHR